MIFIMTINNYNNYMRFIFFILKYRLDDLVSDKVISLSIWISAEMDVETDYTLE